MDDEAWLYGDEPESTENAAATDANDAVVKEEEDLVVVSFVLIPQADICSYTES